MGFFRKQKTQYIPSEIDNYQVTAPVAIDQPVDPLEQAQQFDPIAVEQPELDNADLTPVADVQTVRPVVHHPYIIDIIAPWELTDTSQLAPARVDQDATHVEISTEQEVAFPEPLMMMPIGNFAANS